MTAKPHDLDADPPQYPSSLLGSEGARLRAWSISWPGRAVLAAERAVLDAVLPNLFGYYLVQIGSLADPQAVNASRIRSRVCVVEGRDLLGDDSSLVVGSPQALPFAADSVDVVLLQHVLEFQRSPHEALREAERVLVPEGHLVLAGFNPYSLFGLWRATDRRRASPPWSGRFVSLTRVKDWLALLGLEPTDVRMVFFRPPFSRPALLRRLRRMESIGARLWPYTGAVYVVVARKRIATLTPIKPRWVPRRSLVGIRVAEPSARRESDPTAPRRRWRDGIAA